MSSEEPERRPLLAATSGALDAGVTGTGARRQGAGSGAGETGTAGTFKRNLGTLEAFAIVISIVIGSGVFTSPGSIDTNVPSPGVALVVWFVGGILAWTGASTMAELGTAIPGEGGVQPYLKYIFGDVFGFLAAWTWVVAVMPATLAILSIVFIESIYSAAGVTDQGGSILHKLLSIVVLVVISVANSISTKASTRLNNFFVVTKFVTIVAIVLAGVMVVVLQLVDRNRTVGGGDWVREPWFGYRDSINPDGSVTHWANITQWELFGYLSAALYAALWAYSGWDKAIYISAELSAPARQLPLAINTSIPTIILCFITANAAYYILLPWNVVSTTDSVAVTAITRLLGPAFGILAAVLICLVVAGSLLGNSFVAGRMTVAAANQNWLPKPLSIVGRVGIKQDERESTSDAPVNAIIVSTILSSLYILFGNFRALLTFNGLGEYTFFFLTVVGAIVLRYREPQLARPYKPLIVIPILFALVSGFVVIRGAVFAPVPALVLVGLWGAGLVFYFVRQRYQERGLDRIFSQVNVSSQHIVDQSSIMAFRVSRTLFKSILLPHITHPPLPSGASYLNFGRYETRNAMTRHELQRIKDQLIQANTSPKSGRQLFLPFFKPRILGHLERSQDLLTNEGKADEYAWLISSRIWQQERKGLPKLLVLASPGFNVFSSGHHLEEVRNGSREEVREIFALCAEVMSLIRRSPILVLGKIHGIASGAGAQIALATDVPVTSEVLTDFIFPGADLGLPCTSPAAGVSRLLDSRTTWLALAKGGSLGLNLQDKGVIVTSHSEQGSRHWQQAQDLLGGDSLSSEKPRHNLTAVEAVGARLSLDDTIDKLVTRLTTRDTQQTAITKWAFWTQTGLRGQPHIDADGVEVEGCGGDGFEDAVAFASRVMALHSQSEVAKDGISSFLHEKELQRKARRPASEE
ncbi:amino acid permease-domain-containing protein [Triangularia verruculosa]|uniref:Amino acid permease-domain-containing protein n=1 Tax=Triangularia verruculosa TaxID=2587418 RepID=A0AAN6XH33_9PEZI|nr:amino acid permease-domain-containing protein [Triangularia verruculosa]